MKHNILFIGGGRMASAMAKGLVSTGLVSPAQISVADPHPQALDAWANHLPNAQRFAHAKEAIASANITIVAVKPQIVPHVLREITETSPHVWSNQLIVSIAAGVTMTQLTEWTGAGRVIRVMPNTPAMVGMGASGYCCSKDVTIDDRATIQLLLDAVGMAVEVPEYQLDAVTGLSGSGPAYVFTFIEALADGGVMAGLPRDMALKLAIQTVRGAAELLLQSGEHPGALKDAVASPAGTTIAGIARLEQNAFRSAAIQAVVAAAKRSEELRQSS